MQEQQKFIFIVSFGQIHAFVLIINFIFIVSFDLVVSSMPPCMYLKLPYSYHRFYNSSVHSILLN